MSPLRHTQMIFRSSKFQICSCCLPLAGNPAHKHDTQIGPRSHLRCRTIKMDMGWINTVFRSLLTSFETIANISLFFKNETPIQLFSTAPRLHRLPQTTNVIWWWPSNENYTSSGSRLLPFLACLWTFAIGFFALILISFVCLLSSTDQRLAKLHFALGQRIEVWNLQGQEIENLWDSWHGVSCSLIEPV